ncbi:MAG TPA: zf-HC2 domain-containing protein [Vicinamibacterales bacterium]
MPKCSVIDPLVTPYVDGELQGADRAVLEQHLQACPPCYQRVRAERAVRDLLQTRKPSLCDAAAPPVLRAACARLAGAAAAPGSRQSAGPALPASRFATARRLEPLAIAAALVMLVGGAFVYRLTDSSPRVLAAELAADHVKCFAMNRVLGTHHSSADVEGEMASRFDWKMDLPADPGRAGLELVGSRPCLYGEGKIAHIMYRHNGHPVSLFMLPRTTKSEQVVDVLGHEAAIWSVGDRTFVLVAREARSEVERLASFVHRTLQTH